jgi:hypothetical protein
MLKFSRTSLTVASVTAGLATMVDNLRTVSAEQAAEKARQFEISNKALDLAVTAGDEQRAAERAAIKIEELFS